MSNHSNSIQPSSNFRYNLSALFVLTIIGIIGLIIIFLYFYNRPAPLNATLAVERKAKLAEVNSKQNEIISTYGWVDQPNSVVRIPVERAMALTVEELKAKNAGGRASKAAEANSSKN